jgi:hypothetical protein
MSTEVTQATPSPLPDLVRPQAAANRLSIEDVTLPRLYRGEKSSNAVENGDAPLGCVYIAQGSDDPNPIVVADPAPKGQEVGPTIRAHVLGVKKGLSLRENNELRTWPFGDPSAPAAARITYDFTLVLPEVDQDVPVKVLMASTSTGTAKRINFDLLKLDDPSRWPELAFDLALKKRSRTEGGKTDTWFVWIANVVEADEGHVAIARKIATLIDGVAGDQTPAPPPAQPEI